MQEAYRLAQEKASKAAEKAKRQYDKGFRSSILEPGDRVLVRNLSERGGPGKLRSYWEQEIHVVVKRITQDTPVYEVRAENGQGRSRVLHRNLLFQCDELPIDRSEKIVTKTKRVRTRKELDENRRTTEPVKQVEAIDSDSSDATEVWRWVQTTPDPERAQGTEQQQMEEPDAAPAEQAEESEPDNHDVDQSLESDDSGASERERQELGRPQRMRRPPTTFTYDELGNPSYQQLQAWQVQSTRPPMIPVPNGMMPYPQMYGLWSTQGGWGHGPRLGSYFYGQTV